jgi:hypothetical protein
MLYRGIDYDVKMAGGLNQWVWTVYTPRPKQGRAAGQRTAAERAAKRAIDAWCYQNPSACREPDKSPHLVG